MAIEKYQANVRKFCELYVNGVAPYGGNAVRCYSAIFNDTSLEAGNNAQMMLESPEAKMYIAELEERAIENSANVKRYLTRSLKGIIDECSTAEYRDRRGTLLSPAALRSVAVSAAKALMELYPVRESQATKFNIEGNGENSITFNVIVPNKSELGGGTAQ